MEDEELFIGIKQLASNLVGANIKATCPSNPTKII